MIQVDTPWKRPFVPPTQDGHPVAFVSKALTPAEQHYVNTECEMLACFFVVEKFHIYVFGYALTVESDQKTLKQVKLKDLKDAPVCLNRMLHHLQNYDVTIKCHPGKEMFVADDLSHYAPPDTPDIPLNIAINHIHITPEKKTEFKAAIHDDAPLHCITDTMLAGWPENINNVPHHLHPYHAHHYVLTVEDGLILCGKALVIPPTKGEKALQAILKTTWASPSASTVLNNVFTGLESIQPSNTQLKHVLCLNINYPKEL